MARLVVLHFTNLPPCNFLYWILTRNYLNEKPHCTVNILYVVFCGFVINCENQEWISLKFHKFPRFTDILNSEKNGIVGGKLVWPGKACRVSFWPSAQERLPTPVVSVRGPHVPNCPHFEKKRLKESSLCPTSHWIYPSYAVFARMFAFLYVAYDRHFQKTFLDRRFRRRRLFMRARKSLRTMFTHHWSK